MFFNIFLPKIQNNLKWTPFSCKCKVYSWGRVLSRRDKKNSRGGELMKCKLRLSSPNLLLDTESPCWDLISVIQREKFAECCRLHVRRAFISSRFLLIKMKSSFHLICYITFSFFASLFVFVNHSIFVKSFSWLWVKILHSF